MNCPIEAIDYESSLIQADWYEEHSQQEVADEIRHMNMPKSHYAVLDRGQVKTKVSRSRTKYNNLSVSECKSKTWFRRMGRSFCSSISKDTDRIEFTGTQVRSRAWSTCQSRSGV